MADYSSPAATIKPRNYGLDFLKIAATILIVFYHYQLVTETKYSTGINYFGGRFYFGRIVELFFLISGYLMYQYIEPITEGKYTLKDWYVKRAARLLPMVAISVVVFEICIYFHGLLCYGEGCHYNGVKVNLWGSVITALGWQDVGVFTNPGVNNPTWYISVLLLVYIVFFIATQLAKRLHFPPVYLYIFIILCSCGSQRLGLNLPFLTDSTTRGYSCFFFGLLLAGFVRKHGVSRKLAIADICVLIGLLCFFAFENNMLEAKFRYLLCFVFYPGLILLTETNTAKKVLRHKFWGTWGQTSLYSVVT